MTLALAAVVDVLTHGLVFLVEQVGIEPTAFDLRSQCSPD